MTLGSSLASSVFVNPIPSPNPMLQFLSDGVDALQMLITQSLITSKVLLRAIVSEIFHCVLGPDEKVLFTDMTPIHVRIIEWVSLPERANPSDLCEELKRTPCCDILMLFMGVLD